MLCSLPFKYMIIARFPSSSGISLIKLYDLTLEPPSQDYLNTLRVDCFPGKQPEHTFVLLNPFLFFFFFF